MANKERDLKELKRRMDSLFRELRWAVTEDEKMRVMEEIQMCAETMELVVARRVA